MVCLDQRTFYKYRYYAGFRICRVFNEKKKVRIMAKNIRKNLEKNYLFPNYFQFYFKIKIRKLIIYYRKTFHYFFKPKKLKNSCLIYDTSDDFYYGFEPMDCCFTSISFQRI